MSRPTLSASGVPFADRAVPPLALTLDPLLGQGPDGGARLDAFAALLEGGVRIVEALPGFDRSAVPPPVRAVLETREELALVLTGDGGSPPGRDRTAGQRCGDPRHLGRRVNAAARALGRDHADLVALSCPVPADDVDAVGFRAIAEAIGPAALLVRAGPATVAAEFDALPVAGARHGFGEYFADPAAVAALGVKGLIATAPAFAERRFAGFVTALAGRSPPTPVGAVPDALARAKEILELLTEGGRSVVGGVLGYVWSLSPGALPALDCPTRAHADRYLRALESGSISVETRDAIIERLGSGT